MSFLSICGLKVVVIGLECLWWFKSVNCLDAVLCSVIGHQCFVFQSFLGLLPDYTSFHPRRYLIFSLNVFQFEGCICWLGVFRKVTTLYFWGCFTVLSNWRLPELTEDMHFKMSAVFCEYRVSQNYKVSIWHEFQMLTYRM